MQFPYTYFEDEVRDGFYVPGTMKRAWAAQMEILDDIRKVCEKYKIQYFAQWGTLLGAVRHEGFIPWDDDMDICMKREDYNKFLSVAEKELPQGYRFMSFRNDDYWEMLIRVLNGKQIRFDDAYLEKFHGFPYVAGIDVFPLDYLSTDEEEEKLRDDLINFTASVADALDREEFTADDIERKLCQVEELCNVKLDRNAPVKRQLYILMDQLFSLYGEEEAEYITVMPLWLRENIYKLPKSYYQETVMLPFENMLIPVPAAYDAVLRASYGDYMKPVRSWDTHDYPFYKRQEKQLEQYGIKPQRYVFSADDLQKEGHAMKKKAKERAEEIIRLLEKAHSQMLRAAAIGDIQAALDLLEKCQGGAVSLGTMIEQSEGAGHAVVGMLEEYCEFVYQVYEGLKQQSGVNLEQVCKSFKEWIEAIAGGIQDGIRERMEVVFLPYKASMWDSLESVWKAAEDDPDCDAYVVPIPYYDKNIDGSFREMHYEGEQYPDYVPVTWYEDYDFAGRQPDMIFIHNPYDEYNHVTSVHPFFYAKNLKQFTDKLIYIPYFVLDEINPEDKRAVMGMEHFVTVPGVIHADQVIVQSENMRLAYIDALVRFAGEDTRGVWEKKILGLGSPKFDKVLNTKKEDLEIPEEWRNVLEKPDGSWKKVVLYNTSVAALLEHNEKMLEKMEDVFRVFRDNRDEVALLWRPHPLIKAAIEAMRPQLWEKYCKIVERYRKENWGIFDDTADLNRAIVLSDGYYGDGSSVAVLYQQMGKPLLIQSVDILCHESKKEDYLWSYNFVVDEDEMWFVPFHYNRLCRYNLREKKIDFIKQIPVKNDIDCLYANIAKIGSYLIMTPCNAKEICIFDTKENKIDLIPLNKVGQKLDWFGISVIWEGQLFLFPFYYPAICKLDIQNGLIEYLTDWYGSCGFEKQYMIFQWDYHTEGSIVYLLSAQSNKIFKFNMSNESYEIIAVGEKTECYSTIHFESERKIYLSDQYGNVVIYDHIDQITEKINNQLEGFQIQYHIPGQVCFIDNIRIGESIYYIPGQADRIMVFDTKTYQIKEYNQAAGFLDTGKNNPNFSGSRFSVIHLQGDVLYGFDIYKRYFFEIDRKTEEIKYHIVLLDQEMLSASVEDKAFEPFMLYKCQLEGAALYSNMKMMIHELLRGRAVRQRRIKLSGENIYLLLKK